MVVKISATLNNGRLAMQVVFNEIDVISTVQKMRFLNCVQITPRTAHNLISV